MPGTKDLITTGIPILLSGLVSYVVSKIIGNKTLLESDKRHICNKFDEMQTKCAIYWGNDGQQPDLATEITVGLRSLSKDIIHCHANKNQKATCKNALHAFFRRATSGTFETHTHKKSDVIRKVIISDGQVLREKLTALFD